MVATVRDSRAAPTRHRKTSSTVVSKSPTADDNVEHHTSCIMEHVYSETASSCKDPSPHFLLRALEAKQWQIGHGK